MINWDVMTLIVWQDNTHGKKISYSPALSPPIQGWRKAFPLMLTLAMMLRWFQVNCAKAA